jgi:phosphoribulokinase
MNNQRPIILGIVGDSAVGKTTITAGLTKLLGPERVTHIRTDDYHKYDRRERARLNISPLHPDCNYLDILAAHLERLRAGKPILKPVYNHTRGKLVRPEYVQPREFIIVEGLLGLHNAELRQWYDVKVYLDLPEELRRIWKIKRDTTRRGYNPEQVRAELAKRQRDSFLYIRPQRHYADIVIQFSLPEGAPPERAGTNLNTRLILRPTLPHPDLSYLLDPADPNQTVRLKAGHEWNTIVEVLDIDYHVTPAQAATLERAIWQHLPDLHPLSARQFGDYDDRTEVRHSDSLALTQLLLTYHLLRGYRDHVQGAQGVASMPKHYMRQLRTVIEKHAWLDNLGASLQSQISSAKGLGVRTLRSLATRRALLRK